MNDKTNSMRKIKYNKKTRREIENFMFEITEEQKSFDELSAFFSKYHNYLDVSEANELVEEVINTKNIKNYYDFALLNNEILTDPQRDMLVSAIYSHEYNRDERSDECIFMFIRDIKHLSNYDIKSLLSKISRLFIDELFLKDISDLPLDLITLIVCRIQNDIATNWYSLEGKIKKFCSNSISSDLNKNNKIVNAILNTKSSIVISMFLSYTSEKIDEKQTEALINCIVDTCTSGREISYRFFEFVSTGNSPKSNYAIYYFLSVILDNFKEEFFCYAREVYYGLFGSKGSILYRCLECLNNEQKNLIINTIIDKGIDFSHFEYLCLTQEQKFLSRYSKNNDNEISDAKKMRSIFKIIERLINDENLTDKEINSFTKDIIDAGKSLPNRLEYICDVASRVGVLTEEQMNLLVNEIIRENDNVKLLINFTEINGLTKNQMDLIINEVSTHSGFEIGEFVSSVKNLTEENINFFTNAVIKKAKTEKVVYYAKHAYTKPSEDILDYVEHTYTKLSKDNIRDLSNALLEVICPYININDEPKEIIDKFVKTVSKSENSDKNKMTKMISITCDAYKMSSFANNTKDLSKDNLNYLTDVIINSKDYKTIYYFAYYTNVITDKTKKELLTIFNKNISFWGFSVIIFDNIYKNSTYDTDFDKIFFETLLETRQLDKIAYYLFVKLDAEMIRQIFGTTDNFIVYCDVNKDKLRIDMKQLSEKMSEIIQEEKKLNSDKITKYADDSISKLLEEKEDNKGQQKEKKLN